MLRRYSSRQKVRPSLGSRPDCSVRRPCSRTFRGAAVMCFEHAITVMALAMGPAAIWSGWRSPRMRRARARTERTRRRRRPPSDRGSRLSQARCPGACRSLTHGAANGTGATPLLAPCRRTLLVLPAIRARTGEQLKGPRRRAGFPRREVRPLPGSFPRASSPSRSTCRCQTSRQARSRRCRMLLPQQCRAGCT